MVLAVLFSKIISDELGLEFFHPYTGICYHQEWSGDKGDELLIRFSVSGSAFLQTMAHAKESEQPLETLTKMDEPLS